jgi:hypothetical protein
MLKVVEGVVGTPAVGVGSKVVNENFRLLIPPNRTLGLEYVVGGSPTLQLNIPADMLEGDKSFHSFGVKLKKDNTMEVVNLAVYPQLEINVLETPAVVALSTQELDFGLLSDYWDLIRVAGVPYYHTRFLVIYPNLSTDLFLQFQLIDLFGEYGNLDIGDLATKPPLELLTAGVSSQPLTTTKRLSFLVETPADVNTYFDFLPSGAVILKAFLTAVGSMKTLEDLGMVIDTEYEITVNETNTQIATLVAPEVVLSLEQYLVAKVGTPDGGRFQDLNPRLEIGLLPNNPPIYLNPVVDKNPVLVFDVFHLAPNILPLSNFGIAIHHFVGGLSPTNEFISVAKIFI